MAQNKIDFVIPWVDGSDPEWQKKKALYSGVEYNPNDAARFRDWDTLKYWFRGVEKFAPWVGDVYFISDNQKPEWLNLNHPKLKWVKHSDYIPKEYLPTFNSHTIIWNLHRIETLSENFVLFNDDVFLINKAEPSDFFKNGLPCDWPQIRNAVFSGDFTHIVVNNHLLMQKHFSLKKSAKENLGGWLKAQKPSFLAGYLFNKRGLTPVLTDWHVQTSYSKKTFEAVWTVEFEKINQTCLNKFRSNADVSDWCLRYWQIYNNNFVSKKPIGKYFEIASLDKNNKLIKCLKGKNFKTICLNDTENEVNFNRHKQVITSLLEEILPEKSSFEV